MKKCLCLVFMIMVLLCGCGEVGDYLQQFTSNKESSKTVEDAGNPEDVVVDESEYTDIIIEETQENAQIDSDIEEKDEIIEVESVLVDNYVGLELTDAKILLLVVGIDNISVISEDGEIITDNPAFWEVKSQSSEAGSKVSKNEQFRLICKRKTVNIYEKICVSSSEPKKPFSLDMYINDELSGMLEEGEYRNNIKVEAGSYIFRFENLDNEEQVTEYQLDVFNDTVLALDVLETKDKISISNVEIDENYAQRVVVVPNMVDVRSDFAEEQLKELNVNNYSLHNFDKEVTPNAEMTIFEQNVEPESYVLSEDLIIFNCVPTSDYLLEKYKDLLMEEFRAQIHDEGYKETYIKKNYYGEYTEEFLKKSSEERNKWRIVSITDETTPEEKKLTVEVIYTGEVEMPNLVNVKLDDAKLKLKEIGFDNIEIDNSTSVTNPNMLIVTSQNVQAQKIVNADTTVILKVKKRVLAKTTPTPIPTPEPTKKAEEKKPSIADYSFAGASGEKYASSTVNVRDLPDIIGNKIGSLTQNQKVTVTGKCNETGWYRIVYGDGEGYVSQDYLVNDKIVAAPKAVEKSTNSDSSSVDKNSGGDGSYGTVTNNTTTTEGEYKYIGNKSNHKLHKITCSGKLPKESNRKYFRTLEEAVAAGYTEELQCKHCRPFNN